MPFVEKKIISGDVTEVEQYFCTRDGRRIPRGANIGDTPEDVAKVNEKNSWKQLARLIRCNFSGRNGDMLWTLAHDDRSMTEERAKRELTNALERINRLRKRKGLPPTRWIAITEKQSQWHHHVILQGGLTLEEIKEIWGNRGRIMVSPLQDTNDHEELAKYLTGQHKPKKGEPSTADSVKQKRTKGSRRWRASKNLKQPVVTKRLMGRPPRMGQPTAPKGHRLLTSWFIGCDMLGNLFRYYSYVPDGGGVAAKGAPKARAGVTKGVWGRSPNGERGGAPALA